MNEVWTAVADGLTADFGASIRLVRGVEPCLERFGELDAVVANLVDRSYYERSPRLKALFVPFVGVNHLPAELLIERGVQVYNCHGNAESVAERALALALAGFGRLVEYHNDLAALRWHGFWVGKGREDFWHSIYRRRCAILGTGAIGVTLARLLKAFDCRVVGYRRRADGEAPANFDEVTTDLRAALGSAEIVFVALPLTDSTRGLLGAEELAAMRGAYLVNVGRGEVVEEGALYTALADGTLAGAGLDVWYTYPKDGADVGAPSRYPIHELPNVVLSPHVGGSTYEAVELNASQTGENLARWLRSGEARHRVDLLASY